MGSAFRVIVKAFKDIWGDMFQLAILNVVTLLAIFGPFLLILAAMQLLGIEVPGWVMWAVLALTFMLPFGPAALLGLYTVCNRSTNEFAFSYDHYWGAVKQYWRPAWLYGVISTVVTGLLVFNYFWYGTAFGGQTWAAWVQGAWMALTLFWIVIQFYIYPFYVEQEDKRWRIALRNAALVSAANPVFTFVVLVIACILVGISLALTPVFVLLGLAVWAMFGTGAVINRVNLYREKIKADTTKQDELSQGAVNS